MAGGWELGSLASGASRRALICSSAMYKPRDAASRLAVLDKVAASDARILLPDHSARSDGSMVTRERQFLADVRSGAWEREKKGHGGQRCAAFTPSSGGHPYSSSGDSPEFMAPSVPFLRHGNTATGTKIETAIAKVETAKPSRWHRWWTLPWLPKRWSVPAYVAMGLFTAAFILLLTQYLRLARMADRRLAEGPFSMSTEILASPKPLPSVRR